jgi:hypothetical protein
MRAGVKPDRANQKHLALGHQPQRLGHALHGDQAVLEQPALFDLRRNSGNMSDRQNSPTPR